MKLARVDFLRPAREGTRVGWLLLGVGVLAVAGAAWQQHEWQLRAERLESLREQAEQAQRALRRPVLRKEPTRAQRRRQEARAAQQFPWLPVLHSIEAATRDPVYLRALAIDPSTGEVTLEAEAPSFDRAMEYLQSLDADQVLQPASILSHEPITDAFGNPAVTFAAATRRRTP